MAVPVSFEQLHRDPELIEALSASFDFTVVDDAPALAFSVEPIAHIRLIARDKSGGEFLLYGEKRHVLHVTSEGQAGVIARDFADFLELLITHPYWFDLLHFSVKGQLEEMKKTAERLEEQCHMGRRERQLEAHRRLLRERLGPGNSDDVIERLHIAVTKLGRDIHVLAHDGSRYDSLFNTFSSAKLPPNRSVDLSIRQTRNAGLFVRMRKWCRRGLGR